MNISGFVTPAAYAGVRCKVNDNGWLCVWSEKSGRWIVMFRLTDVQLGTWQGCVNYREQK